MYKIVETKPYTLKEPMDQKEITRKIRKYLQINKNENKTYQSFWNTIKVLLKRNFVAINTYIKKYRRSQINDLTL